MEALTKQELRGEGQPELASLAKLGFEVHKFTAYHFRVAKRIDIFPSDRRSLWAWHDVATDKRGKLHKHDVSEFVAKYLLEHPLTVTDHLTALSSPGEFVHEMMADAEPPTFMEALKALYCSDAPWEKIWELVKAEIERRSP